MGLIDVPGNTQGIYYSKNGFLKIRGRLTPYDGSTFLIATCFTAGTTGGVEPVWAQLDNGAVFQDGSATWRVSNIPTRPSFPNWTASTFVAQGSFIKARSVKTSTKGVKMWGPVSNIQHHHRVPTSPFYVGTKHFDSVQSNVRRAFLRRIYVYVLTGSDRAAWDALALTETFDNFKGMHKAYSGWELFEYCNQGLLPPQHHLADGTVKFDTQNLPPYSTLAGILPKPFAV